MSKMTKMQEILNVPAVVVEEGGVKDPQAVVSWEPEVSGEQGSEIEQGDSEVSMDFDFVL